MNKNQLSKYSHSVDVLVISFILLILLFNNVFAQDLPKKDTTKQSVTIHHVDNKSLPDNLLIVLDGKVVDLATVKAMNLDDIYSINVFKGKIAIDIYGRKREKGVIVVESNLRSKEKNDLLESRISSMLKSFYTGYITESSKMPEDFKKIDSIKNQYCTTSLLRKIKRLKLDYDIFLEAQDVDTVILKTLNIRKDPSRNNLYSVSHFDIFNNKTKTIELMIVREKENYKIGSLSHSVWL